MNSNNCLFDGLARRPRGLVVLVGVLAFALFSATGGCQGRREPQATPGRILFDSLLAANEALHDSAGPTLGYHRMGCLYMRATLTLDFDTVFRIADEADEVVRSRHSRAEEERVNRRLQGNHPIATPEDCQRIDSLWYARVIKPSNARRQP
jgi:hypothetical protein